MVMTTTPAPSRDLRTQDRYCSQCGQAVRFHDNWMVGARGVASLADWERLSRRCAECERQSHESYNTRMFPGWHKRLSPPQPPPLDPEIVREGEIPGHGIDTLSEAQFFTCVGVVIGLAVLSVVLFG